MTASPLQVSQLLFAWSNGDQTAFDRLMLVVNLTQVQPSAHRREVTARSAG